MSLRTGLVGLLLAAATLAGEPRVDFALLLAKVVKGDGVDYATLKKERAALKRYLKNGGFLFAESCCGRKGFDRSF